MRSVWVHIHIQKCGGTTFLEQLRRLHGRALFETDRKASKKGRPTLPCAQVVEALEGDPTVTCMAGHRFSLDLPFADPRFQVTASAIVRDPVDWFLSMYFFHRNNAKGKTDAKRMDLDAYIRWALDDGSRSDLSNGQIQRLGAEPSPAGLRRVEELIDARRLHLFPLSQYAEALVLLNRLHPERFRDYPPGALRERRNVSTQDQPVSPEQRKRIAAFQTVDHELLALAHRCVLQRTAEAGLSAEELAAAVARLAVAPVPLLTRIARALGFGRR
jgi:hypothetical protein